ncbi:hypothetical protein V1509DRAFT_557301, partial [Lipomyces kononenkoae]
CTAAVVAISFAGFDVIDLFSTYANGIHAMSTVTVPEDSNLAKVGPPNTRRPPGRPHKKRNRTEDIGIRSTRV